MGLILGVPERADPRGYEYLRGNSQRLVLVLAAFYLASALGEEVTNRGFLVTRIAELGSGDKGATLPSAGVNS